MKFLKKFNEELEPWTYQRAAAKLKKLGHERRAKSLEEWGKQVRNIESLKKWEDNREKFSKWGKATIKFLNNQFNKITGDLKQEVFRGDFYLVFHFDDVAHLENIETGGDFNFSIQLSVGLVPVDNETLELCLKHFPDNDFWNGFFWGLWARVQYKVEKERLHFVKVTYNPYDESLTLEPHFVDRKGALTFKKGLMACFDENDEYPSGYDNDPFIYDVMFRTLCQKLELSADYNFYLDRVMNDIKGYSHNYFFKD